MLKLTFVSSLSMIVLMALMTQHCLLVWVWLELSSFIFVGLMACSMKRLGSESVKYFLLQASAGIFLLGILVTNKAGSGMVLIASVLLLIKSGVPPFHQWVLSLAQSLSWMSLYMLSTIMKIIPWTLLQIATLKSIILFVFLSLSVGCWGALTSHGLKSIFVFSSCSSAGMILSVMSSSHQWVWLFVIYCFFSAPGFILGLETSSGGTEETEFMHWGAWSKLYLTLFVLNLGGMPPLPGFFFKVEFVMLLGASLSLGFFLVMASIGLMYAYLLIALKALAWESSTALKFNQAIQLSPLLVFLSGTGTFMLILRMGVNM